MCSGCPYFQENKIDSCNSIETGMIVDKAPSMLGGYLRVMARAIPANMSLNIGEAVSTISPVSMELQLSIVQICKLWGSLQYKFVPYMFHSRLIPSSRSAQVLEAPASYGVATYLMICFVWKYGHPEHVSTH